MPVQSGDLQPASATTTNAILVLFINLPENHKSNREIDLIFRFSMKFWIIYSHPRILSDNGDEELLEK
jgi:hypothetical protein